MRNSEHHLAILLLSIAIILAPELGQANEPNSDILGQWKIVRHISPDGATSSLTQRDVEKIVGQSVLVTNDLFRFNGRTCVNPNYQRSEDDAAQHFYTEWRVNSEQLPVEPRVTIFENRCQDNVLYPTGADRMLVAEEGFFFEAVRVPGESVAGTLPAKVQRQENDDIFGTWTIDGVDWKGSGYDSNAAKTKRAKVFMGMQVYLSLTRFSYNGITCEHPGYKRRRQAKKAYFRGDWRSVKGRLSLPETLTVIETECGAIYPMDKSHLLIEDHNGTFFSAVRLR